MGSGSTNWLILTTCASARRASGPATATTASIVTMPRTSAACRERFDGGCIFLLLCSTRIRSCLLLKRPPQLTDGAVACVATRRGAGAAGVGIVRVPELRGQGSGGARRPCSGASTLWWVFLARGSSYCREGSPQPTSPRPVLRAPFG